MIKSLSIAALICVTFCTQAQYNVHFEKKSWSETVQQAEEENKLIFIDGFTTWCEPCKMMDIQVFNRSHVARFFNRNFVNYKMDMEKDNGPLFVVNYGIKEYPSFLFLTSDGTLVHKFQGYKHADEMIASAQPALERERKIEAWDKRYQEGGRKPDFLYNYTFACLQRMDDSHKQVVQEYLSTQEDWGTDKNIKFIYQFMEDIDSEMFLHMAKNRSQYELVIGKDKVSKTIDIMVNNKIHNSSPTPSIEEVMSLYRLAYPEGGENLAQEYALEKYQAAGDFDRYADIAIVYYSRPEHKPAKEDLKLMISEFYDRAQDPNHLAVAYGWAKEILDDEYTIEHASQVIDFQYKLKKKQEGLATLKRAVKFAKKAKMKSKAKEFKAIAKKFKSMT